MAAGVASDGSTEPGDGASTELFGEETTNQDSLEPEAGELLWLLEDCGVPIWNSGVVAEAVVLDCPATTQALEHKRLQRTHNLNPSYKQAPFKENHCQNLSIVDVRRRSASLHMAAIGAIR